MKIRLPTTLAEIFVQDAAASGVSQSDLAALIFAAHYSGAGGDAADVMLAGQSAAPVRPQPAGAVRAAN